MKRLFLLTATAFLFFASAPLQAYEAGQWVLRGGIGMVDPKSDNLDFGGIDLGGGISLTSATIQVDSATSLTLSATYMFTPNWAFDILAAWPFEHDIDVDATLTDGVTTVSDTVKLGETKHLPPTFSVQYHFVPDGRFQPYVGAGINWTTFFSEDLTSDAVDGGIVDMNLDDSFGLAAQIGADWQLNDKWLLNLDVRWINIESEVELTIDDGTGRVTGDIGDVEIDPWVYSVNLGYRF